MLGCHRVAQPCQDPLVGGQDAGRLVDRQLLGQREMQVQVQEGIAFPTLWQAIACIGHRRGFKQPVILRMRGDDVGGDRLQGRQRFAPPVLAPRIGEEAARLVAGRLEQAHVRATVLRRYSHRSLIRQFGQSGRNALQT